MARPAALCLCLLACAFGVHRSNVWLDARAQETIASGDVGPLPDGRMLHVLSLGFERLVADLFWIRTVYYVGDERSADAKWPAAERLAHLVTDIDPRFESVYVLMSSVLNGLRVDPDAAIGLLEKGAATSKYWRIHFLLGFNYFMDKQDYARGAESLERAIELGGPDYLKLLVSRLYAQAGDADTAMAFLQARLQQEESERVRKKLARRISDLHVNRDLRRIDAAIQAYGDMQARAPASIGALVDAGFLREEPRDPKGGAYTIEAGRAVAHVPYEVLEIKR